ncbi:hypothetical protein EXS70_01810 [Candidatus Peribacteria bacterium]|nr:hypothetical protein [Candidatus Peribacteria bacterium]
MPFPAWLPDVYKPMVTYLLELGLVSMFYMWIFVNLAMLLGMASSSLKTRENIETVFTMTAGHYFLTAMASIVVIAAAKAEPQMWLVYTLIGACMVWGTMASELHEDIGGTVPEERMRMRHFFLTRFSLQAAWIFLFVLCAQGNISITNGVLTWLDDLFPVLLEFPFAVGIIFALISVFSLLWVFFRALRSTFGVCIQVLRLYVRTSALPEKRAS